MAHAPEQESEPERPARRWYHPRKTDLAFLFGSVVFLVNGLLRKEADPTVIYASIALMGFSAAGRAEEWLGGGKR